MTRFPTFLCSLMSLFSSTWLHAGSFTIIGSDVSFLAIGKPDFLTIRGKGGTITGHLIRLDDNITGEVKVLLDKFFTGIELRDEHIKKKYLEVEKFPDATLRITRLPFDGKETAQRIPFKGIFHCHGQEKDIEGVAAVQKEQSLYRFEAAFHFSLADYDIDVPSYAGVTLAEKVEVLARFEAEEQ